MSTSLNKKVESNLDTQPRDQFKSKLGFILASAGSAVGLGNIWRFPYLTGANGGGAFVMLYLLVLVVVGVSLLLVEFSIGRNGKANAIDSYAKISKNFKWVGYLGVFTAFIILSYYSVVGGWTIYYTLKSVTGLTAVPADQIGAFFGGFIGNPFLPLVFHAIFMFATIYIVAKGISGGIEKYNKILMPALFIMLFILVARALTLPGAAKGLNFYLNPDFSKITMGTLVAACGQVFFSLSIGLSGMVTYASYLSSEENLAQSAVTVAFTDTLVAFLAGLIIFPAAFAFGLEPGQGPGLVFITLPTVFAQMPMGALFSFLFFALLAIAALTSSISILEMPVSYFIEKLKFTRQKAAWAIGGISYVLGIAVSLSFGMWGDVKIFGKGIFDLFDYFSSNISLPLSGLACAIIVGFVWKKQDVLKEVSSNGKYSGGYLNAWYNLTKYVIPVILAVVFLSSIGILKF